MKDSPKQRILRSVRNIIFNFCSLTPEQRSEDCARWRIHNTMLKDHSSISMLETAAKGIQSLPGLEAVFVGGATTCLYIDDEAIGQLRNTKDVDCTVEVALYFKYSQLEATLREHGFKHVTGENIPLCRWQYNGIIMDIMPDDEKIIGFTNEWYKEGRKHKIEITLPSSNTIFIFPLEYFLASKIEAFNNRGKNDFVGSTDIEDIVAVLDGTLQLSIIMHEKNNATKFVKDSFKSLLENRDFIQSLAGHVENSDYGRVDRINRYLNSLVKQ